MNFVNKYSVLLMVSLLYSCSEFETKLSHYMEEDMPSCTDTTYWRLVDLQEVLGVQYDRLYLIGEEYEEDIAKGTKTDWKDGDFLSWDKDLLLLAKGNKVVYKEEIGKGEGKFWCFDKFADCSDTIVYPFSERPMYSCKLYDTSTMYYVRVDVIRGKGHYMLYSKSRMEQGKSFFRPTKWLCDRDPKKTPWGNGVPPNK